MQGSSSVQVLATKNFHANAPPLALCDGPRPPPEPSAQARRINGFGFLHLHHAHAVHTRSSQLLFLTRPSFDHASHLRHLSRRPSESRTFATPCSAHLIMPSSLSESYQGPLLLAQLRRFDNTNSRPFSPTCILDFGIPSRLIQRSLDHLCPSKAKSTKYDISFSMACVVHA